LLLSLLTILEQMKALLVILSCLSISFVFADESNEDNNSIESYEVPESEFQKREDLETFEDVMSNKTKENEEWKELSIKLEHASIIPESLTENLTIQDYVNDILKNLENEDFKEQALAEQDFFRYLEYQLIPDEFMEDLKYYGSGQELFESREVRGQITALGQSIRSFYNSMGDGLSRGYRYIPNEQNKKYSIADVYFASSEELNKYVENLNTNLAELKQTISNSKNNINDAITANDKEIKLAKGKRNKILSEANKKTDINMWAIWLGIPAFCLTILLLYIIPEWLFRKSPSNRNYNVLLELITVLLLTMTILILGLSGKIGEEVLGTLIGGISAYVLNRVTPNRNRLASGNGNTTDIENDKKD